MRFTYVADVCGRGQQSVREQASTVTAPGQTALMPGDPATESEWSDQRVCVFGGGGGICYNHRGRHALRKRNRPTLGVDQPKVSALIRGRLDGFSSDRLFRFLTALDRDVEIMIRPKSQEAERGRIRVIAA